MKTASTPKAASNGKSTRRKKAPASPADESSNTTSNMPDNNISGPEKNVGQVESLVSATIGGLLLVRGLVPRSFKQATFLLLGGALLYRGMTSHCNMYEALGINTEKNNLLDEVKDKVS